MDLIGARPAQMPGAKRFSQEDVWPVKIKSGAIRLLLTPLIDSTIVRVAVVMGGFGKPRRTQNNLRGP